MLPVCLPCEPSAHVQYQLSCMIYSHRSRCSSRAISSSRAPSPFAHFSIQANHACNSSTKVHGFVQSSVIITTVCGSDVLGGTKCGSNAVYDGAEEGTVYTDSLARVSKLKNA